MHSISAQAFDPKALTTTVGMSDCKNNAIEIVRH